MCPIVYNFQFVPRKKKLGSTPPSKHIFLIIPEFPGKIKKKQKGESVWASFIY